MAQAHLKKIFNYAGVQPGAQKRHFQLLERYDEASRAADKLETPGYKTSEDKKKILEANEKTSAAASEAQHSFASLIASVNGRMEAAVGKAINFYQTMHRLTIGIATAMFLGSSGWCANAIAHLSNRHIFSAPMAEQITIFVSFGGAVISGIAGFFVARLLNKRKEAVESTLIEIEHTLKNNNDESESSGTASEQQSSKDGFASARVTRS